jgi:hypothetical protein
MNYNYAVEQIVSSVKELGIGIQFSYEDVNQWLGIASGDDLMWVYDTLSDRLMAEHSICLELKEDCIIAAVPDDSDIRAAEKRKS